ncbi:MAG TPA: ATP-dependent metallopeptidase FtsH/Yme1/Tma family protein [Candidatus Acidoferrales bacterium]|nr:ATP-dependent metallopeptidase FtsH/Yme1/Tma family protein [Candidatus Acidoferrales bacterium]
MSPVVRTVLYSTVIVLLAVAFWRIATSPDRKSKSLTYNEFESQIETDNIRRATFYINESTADLRAVLKDSGERVNVRIAKELIPDLTAGLRKANVPTKFKTGTDLRELFLNLLPMMFMVIFIAGFWFYLRRAIRKRPPSTPGA